MTVKIDSANVRIVPLCSERITVVGEPNPKYDANGVSRDRSITVEFSKEPAASNFIFTEIPAGAEAIKNEKEEIWAYTLNSQRFFKNIKITNADGYSIAEHFRQPVIDGKLLTIETDKSDPIQFGVGETIKTVIVTLSSDICAADGVTMPAEKSWKYQVTEATDEKATINFVSSSAEGILNAVSRSYSIGQKITLGFTENADYQFVRWDYDSDIIYMENPRKSDTTITVLEKTSESEPTQVKAVCAPRLRTTSFSPVTDTTKTSVSKNTSILIEFSQALPVDDEGLSQLDNISISIGGTPVKSCFLAPSAIGNTVTFTANKSYMIDVPAGQKKNVTVSIPADFYYQLEDGTKVTYGGNGVSFDYKIDDTTNEKADISFIEKNPDSGEFKKPVFTNSSEKNKSYSLGEQVEISFTPKDEWKFNGWKILDAKNNELSTGSDGIAPISVEEPSALTTKLYINEEVQGIKVVADTSKKLAISSVTPNEEENPKDSDIVITFNMPLAEACSEELSKIEITLDGLDVLSNFEEPVFNKERTEITFKSKKRLPVSEGSTKTVKITVPKTFYYMDGNIQLSLESGNEKSFIVNSKSNAFAKITFTQTENAGTLSPTAGTTPQYSLDSEVPIKFVPVPNYQFNGWTVTDSNGNEISEEDIKILDKTALSTKLYVYKDVSDVIVKANASEKLTVTGTPNSGTNPKDSKIEITFNKTLPSTCGTEGFLNKITVYLDGSPVGSYFTERTMSGKKITLTNTKFLKVDGNETKTVTVTVPKDFYYIDGDISVDLVEPYSFSYDVNSTTNSKVKLSYSASLDDSGAINQPPTATYSVGETVDLKFTLTSGYKFKGWRVLDSKDNPVSSEKIEIKDASVISTELCINEPVSDTIRVIADAVLLPKIKEVYPPFTPLGYDQNTTVKIKFNKPMNPESFGNFSCITLKKGEASASSFYGTPYFSEDYTELNIPPAANKPIIPADSDVDVAEISLSMNSLGIKDSDDLSITENLEHVYRVKKTLDDTPPTIKTVRIAKTKEDAEKGKNLITFADYANYGTGTNVKNNIANHHVRTVWIYVEATDEGSGVSSFTVKEKYIRTIDSAPAEQQTVYETSYQNDTGSKDFLKVFEHTFNCSDDGVVNLSFTATDFANKSSDYSKTMDVIKDTKCNVGLTVMDSESKLKTNSSDSEYVEYDVPVLQLDKMGSFSKTQAYYFKDLDGNEYRKSLNPETTAYEEKAEFYSAEYSYDNQTFVPIPLGNQRFKKETIYLGGLFPDELNCTHIKFSVSQYQNVYLKLSVRDAIGNISSKTIFFSKSLDIISCKKNSDKWLFTFDSYVEGQATTPVCLHFTDSKGKSTKNIIYAYANMFAESHSVTLNLAKAEINGTTTKVSELDDGRYYVRCIPITYDSSGPYYTISYAGKPVLVEKKNGTISTVYLDKNGNPLENGTPTQDDLPETFSVTVEPAVLNERSRNVHVRYPDDFTPNPNLNYFVRYHHGTSEPQSTSVMDLTLKTFYDYYNFEIIAMNAAGESVMTDYSVSADLTYDNVPPYLSLNIDIPTPNGMMARCKLKDYGYIRDDGDGLPTDENGKASIKYCYSYDSDAFSNIDWTSNKIKIAYFDPNDKYIFFPFDDSSGDYLYVYLEDKNGNHGWDSTSLYSKVDYTPSLTYDSDGYLLSCNEIGNVNQNYLTDQYFDGTSWKFTNQINTSNTGHDLKMTRGDYTGTGTRKFTIRPTFTASEQNSFARFFNRAWGTNVTNESYYLPLYAYLPYIKSPSSYNCNLDNYNYFVGGRGLSLFVDNPVLVHTFYCSIDLGDQAEDWLYGGIETGVVQYTDVLNTVTSFVYSNANLKEIPKGKYYTTIVHLANGEFFMTDVKQK